MKAIRKYFFLLLSAVCGNTHAQFAFTENKGQWPDHVVACTEIPSGRMYVEKDGLTFLLCDPALMADMHDRALDKANNLYDFHCYRMTWKGGMAKQFEAKKELPSYRNYYIGNDESKWAQGCRTFNEIRLTEVWPGIDVRVLTTGTELKYEFIVAPHTDPAAIRLGFEGIDGVMLREGMAVFPTSVGEVIEKAPLAWAEDDLAVPVDCAFRLHDSELTFDLGTYPDDLPLVIDPDLVFSSFVGAASDNFGFTSCNDSDGNLIGGALVFGSSYPTTPGAFQLTMQAVATNNSDVGISKFSSDGSQLLYSTFLGGNRPEMPHSVVCDSDDNIIVFGQTGSSDFPVTPGCFQPAHAGGPFFDFLSIPFIAATYNIGSDMYLTKFTSGGALAASTYIGGADLDGLNRGFKLRYNYGDDFRGQVTVDADDNIIAAGCTNSANFPGAAAGAFPAYSGGLTDGVVFKLNQGLTALSWSTYIGGNNDDAAYSVQVDPAGNVLVGGGTKSGNLPVSGNAAQSGFSGDVDGFVFKFTENGVFLNGSYTGTSGYDQVYFVQSDVGGNVYLLGQTTGDFTVSPGCYGNDGGGIFIRKLSPGLNTTMWTTRIGSGDNLINISPTAFLLSNCGQIYFSGWGGQTNIGNSGFPEVTTTNGMPLSLDAFQTNTNGSDFYLCVMSLDAADLVYATYFGGMSAAEHVDGGSSTFDKNGSVYQSVCAGCGGTSSFPTTPGAWSTVNPSSNCNLGVFKFDLGQIFALIDITGPGFVCPGETAQFVNLSTGGTGFEWDFGDGTTSTEFEPTHQYANPGLYQVTLFVTDDNECLIPANTTLLVEVMPPVEATIADVSPICPGESALLEATGSDNMYWLPDTDLDASDPENAIASPVTSTVFYLIDFNDCSTDTASVFVQVFDPEYLISPDTSLCVGESVDIFVNPGFNVQWSPAAGLANPNAASTTATPDVSVVYLVTFESTEGCAFADSVAVEVFTDFPGGEVYPESTICVGDSVQLMAEPGTAWEWSPTSTLDYHLIQNPTATPTDTTVYIVQVTNPCGIGTSQVTVNVIIPNASASPGGSYCMGDSVQVWAAGGAQYAWFPQAWISDPFIADPWVYPPETGQFIVLITDVYGCLVTKLVPITVWPLPEVDAGPNQVMFWGDEVTISGSGSGDLNWLPDPAVGCTECAVITVSPDQSTELTLTTVDANGCLNSDAVFIQVNGPVYVPNAITVSGDGKNDIFFAYGVGVEDFKLQVFDRWGELLWETTDMSKGWDATFSGQKVQQDVYVWRMEYTGKTDRRIVYGHVTVIR